MSPESMAKRTFRMPGLRAHMRRMTSCTSAGVRYRGRSPPVPASPWPAATLCDNARHVSTKTGVMRRSCCLLVVRESRDWIVIAYSHNAQED